MRLKIYIACLMENSGNCNDLIKAFQMGDEKGFDFFFRRYYSSLCYFANKILKNEEEARDTVQDCFVKLWNNREQITNKGTLKSLIYIIVRNHCFNRLENRGVVSKAEAELTRVGISPQMDYLSQIIIAETVRQIYGLIELLPTRMQAVFRQYYLEGRNYQEIAETLQTSPETVRKQRQLALRYIKENLGILLAILFFLY